MAAGAPRVAEACRCAPLAVSADAAAETRIGPLAVIARCRRDTSAEITLSERVRRTSCQSANEPPTAATEVKTSSPRPPRLARTINARVRPLIVAQAAAPRTTARAPAESSPLISR